MARHCWRARCSGISTFRRRDEALAAELGSDVPFALLGGTAVGSGRGEEVAPALAQGTYHWVLAFGYHGLSTAAVYRRFDELTPDAAPPEVPADLMNALRSGDSRLLARALSNDLEPAALDLQPRLRIVLQTGLEYGAGGPGVGVRSHVCLPGGRRVRGDRPLGIAECRRVVPHGPARHRSGSGSPRHQLKLIGDTSAFDAVADQQQPQATRELIMLGDIQRGEDPLSCQQLRHRGINRFLPSLA